MDSIETKRLKHAITSRCRRRKWVCFYGVGGFTGVVSDWRVTAYVCYTILSLGTWTKGTMQRARAEAYLRSVYQHHTRWARRVN